MHPYRLRAYDLENFMRLLILLSCLATLLIGCSPDEQKTPKIAETARQALDKAKAVDAATQQAADTSRQSIDEQTQ